MRWPRSLPRCWSWAVGPVATSQPYGPASSASMSCWSNKVASTVGWAGAGQKIDSVINAEARTAGEVIEDDGESHTKIIAFLEQLKVI